MIEDDSRKVVWKTENVPATIPNDYTLSDIANLSVGYLDSYPTYTGKHENGIVVLGFPQKVLETYTAQLGLQSDC